MRRKGTIVRRLAAMTLGAGVLCGLSGCRHQPKLAPLPPVMAPVDLETIPPLANPPLVEVTPEKLPAAPTSAAAAKPKKERRRPKVVQTPPVVVPPVQTASAEPSPVTAIGALTAVGETSPGALQEATDLLASIDKRLNALPAPTTDDQKAQISKVKNFSRDAQQALKSGDAEGAKTLATKAKLLLDDLEKSGAS